jgi:hypothetical protein
MKTNNQKNQEGKQKNIKENQNKGNKTKYLSAREMQVRAMSNQAT